ncbi:hypothetical protein ZWY2020_016027 [Hordeum vulgare]|nr:hypothetical protein ZWY2020_016027 [Hordeum vulgare]
MGAHFFPSPCSPRELGSKKRKPAQDADEEHPGSEEGRHEAEGSGFQTDADANRGAEWGAAPTSQGHERNSDAKQPDSWDGWSSAQANDPSADKWKSDRWVAKGSRRDQRGNPGRHPMRHVERPRYELAAEAKKVLREIDPIVATVRKILRESR